MTVKISGHKITSYELCKLIIKFQYRVPNELLGTLLAIATYYPNPFPSKQSLSRMVGKSEKTIQRYIVKLEQLKFLKREERPGRSTFYRVKDFRTLDKSDQGVTLDPGQLVTPTLDT